MILRTTPASPFGRRSSSQPAFSGGWARSKSRVRTRPIPPTRCAPRTRSGRSRRSSTTTGRRGLTAASSSRCWTAARRARCTGKARRASPRCACRRWQTASWTPVCCRSTKPACAARRSVSPNGSSSRRARFARALETLDAAPPPSTATSPSPHRARLCARLHGPALRGLVAQDLRQTWSPGSTPSPPVFGIRGDGGQAVARPDVGLTPGVERLRLRRGWPSSRTSKSPAAADRRGSWSGPSRRSGAVGSELVVQAGADDAEAVVRRARAVNVPPL